MGRPAEGGERSKRGKRENKHRTLHCCQVTSGGEADDQDDGGQRGEASHDSDSDHPVRLGSTGYTTHGDSTEYRLLQVFPGYHQNSTAGSWDHLYGLRSPSSNNQHAGLLWSRAQPLLPLHRRHHLHHHPHLDLLLPAPSEGHDKGETALHLHVDGVIFTLLATVFYIVAWIVLLSGFGWCTTSHITRHSTICDARVAAGVFGIFNSIAYGLGTYLTYQEYNNPPPELQ